MAERLITRDVRETERIAGVGGFLELRWPAIDTPYDPGPAFYEALEVQQWEILRKIRSAEIPMGGGDGSISRRRTADDFTFTAHLDLDIRPSKLLPDKIPGPPAAGQSSPFPGDRFEGEQTNQFLIAIRFHCGDPLVDGDDSAGYRYYCQRVLLEEVHIINSARGDDVVRVVVKGSGSAPLRRFVGEVLCGHGSLGRGF
jgi:hypothetical protein